jgi:predicted nucleic acid-binding protein
LRQATTSAPRGGECRIVLVDSTVWIDLLRKRSSGAVARLRRLLELGEATAAPVIAQEVLQGAANADAFRALQRYFMTLPLLGADRAVELHFAAAGLYARARWQAEAPRSPHDCLVAVTALFANVPLLHDDRDFERLAVVEPKLKLIPRG